MRGEIFASYREQYLVLEQRPRLSLFQEGPANARHVISQLLQRRGRQGRTPPFAISALRDIGSATTRVSLGRLTRRFTAFRPRAVSPGFLRPRSQISRLGKELLYRPRRLSGRGNTTRRRPRLSSPASGQINVLDVTLRASSCRDRKISPPGRDVHRAAGNSINSGGSPTGGAECETRG